MAASLSGVYKLHGNKCCTVAPNIFNTISAVIFLTYIHVCQFAYKKQRARGRHRTHCLVHIARESSAFCLRNVFVLVCFLWFTLYASKWIFLHEIFTNCSCTHWSLIGKSSMCICNVDSFWSSEGWNKIKCKLFYFYFLQNCFRVMRFTELWAHRSIPGGRSNGDL